MTRIRFALNFYQPNDPKRGQYFHSKVLLSRGARCVIAFFNEKSMKKWHMRQKTNFDRTFVPRTQLNTFYKRLENAERKQKGHLNLSERGLLPARTGISKRKSSLRLFDSGPIVIGGRRDKLPLLFELHFRYSRHKNSRGT